MVRILWSWNTWFANLVAVLFQTLWTDIQLITIFGKLWIIVVLSFVAFLADTHTYRGLFLTVPPDFQYQNENQVAANQDYFFKKFSM